MKTSCQSVVLLLFALVLSSCVTSVPEVVHTQWGRCGELAKTQYFSTDRVRRLEREVFYGFQSQKVLEIEYAPPMVTVSTFDKTGKVAHIEKKDLSHLAHANRGRPHFELLEFPVVSDTKSGYIRVDYFDHIASHPDGDLDTVVYFHKDKYPEDPFGKIENGMTRQEIHDLAGQPVLVEEKKNREQYYSGVSLVTIEYQGEQVTKVSIQTRKKYE